MTAWTALGKPAVVATAMLGVDLPGLSPDTYPVDTLPQGTQVVVIEDQWTEDHRGNNPADRLLENRHASVEVLILDAVERHRNDPALARTGTDARAFRCWLTALIKQESGFSAKARSPKAAFGLTQIIPATARSLGIYPDYYEDPGLQIDGGARYLLDQLERFGSMPLALAAYNAGPEAVKKHGGIPPYSETQNYVAKVIDHYNRYATDLGTVATVNSLGSKELRMDTDTPLPSVHPDMTKADREMAALPFELDDVSFVETTAVPEARVPVPAPGGVNSRFPQSAAPVDFDPWSAPTGVAISFAPEPVSR